MIKNAWTSVLIKIARTYVSLNKIVWTYVSILIKMIMIKGLSTAVNFKSFKRLAKYREETTLCNYLERHSFNIQNYKVEKRLKLQLVTGLLTWDSCLKIGILTKKGAGSGTHTAWEMNLIYTLSQLRKVSRIANFSF